jgi:hypothetical protein
MEPLHLVRTPRRRVGVNGRRETLGTLRSRAWLRERTGTRDAAAPVMTPEEAAKKEAKRLAKLKEKEEKKAKVDAKVRERGTGWCVGCTARRYSNGGWASSTVVLQLGLQRPPREAHVIPPSYYTA